MGVRKKVGIGAWGVVAIDARKGNDKVGEGRMTISEAKDASRVALKLELVKPLACTNEAAFTFVPQADGETKVTWSMDGKNGVIAKALSLVLDMDKLVGADFERGLAALAEESEAEGKAHATR